MHTRDLSFARVYKPLKQDHPLVNDRDRCAKCHQSFYAGQRVTLASLHNVSKPSSVEALPLHATCAYAGLETNKGTIARIKDGDGSPYPVELEGGTQAALEECGLSE